MVAECFGRIIITLSGSSQRLVYSACPAANLLKRVENRRKLRRIHSHIKRHSSSPARTPRSDQEYVTVHVLPLYTSVIARPPYISFQSLLLYFFLLFFLSVFRSGWFILERDFPFECGKNVCNSDSRVYSAKDSLIMWISWRRRLNSHRYLVFSSNS